MADVRRHFTAGWASSSAAAVLLLVYASVVSAQTTSRSPSSHRETSPTVGKSAAAREKAVNRAVPPQYGSGYGSVFQKVTYGLFGPQNAGRTHISHPKAVRPASAAGGEAPELMSAPSMMEQSPGQVIMEGGACGGSCGYGECGECGGGCCGEVCCAPPYATLSFENLELFAGVHGFTGPANRGQTGSFGFHEGVNWGMPLPIFYTGAVGAQVGFQAVHSNFEGAQFTTENRNQTFLTAGLFRRVDWGLQGGVVVDVMHDDWYYSADLTQLRGELSWVLSPCHEVGFWFTGSSKNDDITSQILTANGIAATRETLLTNDLYAFFYRHSLDRCNGVEGRLWAGFSSESDGLIGAELRTALTPRLSLQSDFTYLIPETGAGSSSHVEEAWNVAISLVWFPTCGRAGNYFRPLFPVASNGTFLVDSEARP